MHRGILWRRLPSLFRLPWGLLFGIWRKLLVSDWYSGIDMRSVRFWIFQALIVFCVSPLFDELQRVPANRHGL